MDRKWFRVSWACTYTWEFDAAVTAFGRGASLLDM